MRRMVETEFSREFDHVGWRVEPEAEKRAKALPTLSGDVIFYAAKEVVRNAARHGRGSDPARPLRLSVTVAWKDGLEICVADDGVGMPTAAEATSATGQGLALHGTMLAVIGGSLVTESRPRGGTVVTIFLPRERWEQR